jgi:hypothetical protein
LSGVSVEQDHSDASRCVWMIDCPDADNYIESGLFFENMGATGFDGMTDV